MTNRDANSITVVDLEAGTEVAQWSVERQPLDVAFEPVGKTLWVTNYNDASVTVFTTDGQHIGTVPVGRGPAGIAIDEVNRRAYVANTADRTVSVVDVPSLRVLGTKDLGYVPSGLAVDPAVGRVCMVHPQAFNMFSCYDQDLKRTGSLKSVGELVAIDPVRHDGYGVDRERRRLTAVSAVTGEKVEFELSHVPTGIAVDPVDRLVYVALPDANEILVVSPLN